MQLTCKQSELSQALSFVSRAVPAKPSHPILANILLEAKDNKISLSGFDLSFGIKSSIDANVSIPGSVAIPSKVFIDIVSKLPDGEISLQLEHIDDSTVLKIKYKRNKYDIRVVNADEFPVLPVGESAPIVMRSPDLLIGLRSTIFSASPEESKGLLQGVNIAIDKSSIHFASTDGHRLSALEINNEADVKSSISITIPAKSLVELERMLAKTTKEEDEIKLFIDDFQIVFQWGNYRLTTRALEGLFPNYQQLIPKQFEKFATCDRKELISAIDRLSSLNPKNNIIQIDVDSENSAIELHCTSQDTGTGKEVLESQVSGSNISIAFNADYLIEGLKAIASTEIQIHMNQPLMPAVFTPVGGVKMKYLAMPVEMKG